MDNDVKVKIEKVLSDGTWVICEMSELKRGDMFRTYFPDEEEKKKIFIAESDSKEKDGLWSIMARQTASDWECSSCGDCKVCGIDE